MITEDFVSFETAKLLKEKGFDWKCKRMFRVFKNFVPKVYDSPEWITNEDLCSLYQNCEFATIPTIQMAMKWLRDKGYIIVVRHTNNNGYFGVVEEMEEGKEVYHFDGYNSCEEACESAIKYCLENLI